MQKSGPSAAAGSGTPGSERKRSSVTLTIELDPGFRNVAKALARCSLAEWRKQSSPCLGSDRFTPGAVISGWRPLRTNWDATSPPAT